MKAQFGILAAGLLISSVGFSQDSTIHQNRQSHKNKVVFKNEGRIHSSVTTPEKKEPDIYNPSLYDTRKGSSSPKYNTYQKNDYGAGAVTNNPNKSSGSNEPESTPAVTDSIKK